MNVYFQNQLARQSFASQKTNVESQATAERARIDKDAEERSKRDSWFQTTQGIACTKGLSKILEQEASKGHFSADVHVSTAFSLCQSFPTRVPHTNSDARMLLTRAFPGMTIEGPYASHTQNHDKYFSVSWWL